jgi:heme exporter protein D
MTDNIIATERKTNDRSFVFLSVAFILSVICFSFCGYYIVCHLFFYLWLLYCLSFICLSVAIILSVQKEKQMTDNIIATERKTNDSQYNSHRKKNK